MRFQYVCGQQCIVTYHLVGTVSTMTKSERGYRPGQCKPACWELPKSQSGRCADSCARSPVHGITRHPIQPYSVDYATAESHVISFCLLLLHAIYADTRSTWEIFPLVGDARLQWDGHWRGNEPLLANLPRIFLFRLSALLLIRRAYFDLASGSVKVRKMQVSRSCSKRK